MLGSNQLIVGKRIYRILKILGILRMPVYVENFRKEQPHLACKDIEDLRVFILNKVVNYCQPQARLKPKRYLGSVGTITNIYSRISAAPLKSLYSQKQAIPTYFWVPNIQIGSATEEYVLLTHFINKN